MLPPPPPLDPKPPTGWTPVNALPVPAPTPDPPTPSTLVPVQNASTPESVLVEIKGFAEEWWTFYNSLNDSYFFSIPPEAREIVKNHLRDNLMGEKNALGHASINRHGAPPAFFLLLAGEVFLRDALGDRPSLNFAENASLDDMAFRAYAVADCFRTVVLRKRPTFFQLSNTPLTDADTYEKQPVDGPAINQRTLSLHLGIPVELVVCFADVSNVLAEEDSLTPNDVRTRAADIEKRIHFIATLASLEMWRHTALIYLYTSLLRLGPLARLVRTSLSEILKLADSLAEPSPASPSIFVRSSRACIWFLAATVATTDEDRERCREGLMDCGSGKMFVENHKAIERYWEEVERQGVAPDWKEFIEREKLEVCFL
ncbi:Zn(2)-C6 fungal-type transcription factor [Pseudohyphozyma bogoriensis]|nr:Zn(2)-C6 fungal-type transcription factor [Pseudohyphozyma bogoriensis]